jgi:hypothetical protein
MSIGGMKGDCFFAALVPSFVGTGAMTKSAILALYYVRID